MSRRDEAVEVLAHATPWCIDDHSFGDVCKTCRSLAAQGLDAALAVLQPVVPNEVEALDALPVGTVLRGEGYFGSTVVTEKEAGVTEPYWTEVGSEDSTPVTCYTTTDIRWQVLYLPDDSEAGS